MPFMVPVLAAIGGGSAVAGGVIAAGTAVSAVAAANAAADSHSMAHTAKLQGQQVFAEQQSYAQKLDYLMSHPDSVKDLPQYQFNLDQGAATLDRQMGAKGFHGSGNLAAGLVKYGQDYAKNIYDDQVKTLSSLSGLQTATSPATYGQLAGSLQNQSYKQLGDSLAALGYMTKTGLNGAGGGGGGSGGFTPITNGNNVTGWSE